MADDFDGLTAEAMPLIRKSGKVIGQTAFAFVWLAAMLMTLKVMLVRTEGDPWYAVLGLVALGIGADFWVGCGPVILRSSARWGVKGWTVVGWITLATALAFSYSNKVAYWVIESDNRADAQIAEGVDLLSTERALVAAHPSMRLPGAVKAEMDGVHAAIFAKQDEIAGYPATWPNRLRRAQREKLDLTQQYAALGAEYQTAFAVASAQRRIDAAKVKDAVFAARPRHDDPVVQWVIAAAAAFGKNIAPATALVILHAVYAAFHEMAQFTFLGLATLRIPLHKMEEEHTFLVSQRQSRAKKKVGMVHARTEEHQLVLTANVRHQAARLSIKKIAWAEAELDTAKQMRAIEKARRDFELGVEAEDMQYERQPESRGLPKPSDANKNDPVQPMRGPRQRMFDSDTGDELIPVNYPKFRKKRRVGDRVLATVEREETSAEDERGFQGDTDSRVARPGADAWASPALDEQENVDVDISDIPNDHHVAGGVVDNHDSDPSPERGAEGDKRAPKPIELSTSEFSALLKAGKIDARGIEIATYDEVYGPPAAIAMPDEQDRYLALPAPDEKEDA